MSLTVLLAFYGLVSYSIKYYPLERAIKGYISENEEYCGIDLINKDKGIGFICYNCSKCKGEYYIFINKINGKWIINESSKTIIW